jgi:hypothetical protein
MAARNQDMPEDWPAWIEEVGSSVPDEIWTLVDPDEDLYEEFIQRMYVMLETRRDLCNCAATCSVPKARALTAM